MLTLEKTEAARKGWKPGQSGNPSGSSRSRRVYDGPTVSEYARMYTHDAVKALVHALHHPSTRVPAAIALLDRGWGKPEVRIHAESEQTVLHLVAAMQQGDDLLQTLAKPPQIEGKADDAAKE